MGVTKSRVSQIERGEVSTVETIARRPGTWRPNPDFRRFRRRPIHPVRHRHPRRLTDRRADLGLSGGPRAALTQRLGRRGNVRRRPSPANRCRSGS
ncbi:hypothetical protein [Actinoallomurus vinaceus]|uniref:hypothetical protein n=1 Tax=Actinoallomurus vinaceus TaxID=1080074 RepID=UPI003CD08331